MRASLIRSLALDVLARVLDAGELADRALNRAVRANKQLHSTERRLLTESVYAALRTLGRTDHVLADTLGVAWHRLATPERHRLRLAFALMNELERTASEAAALFGLDEATAKTLERIDLDAVKWPHDAIERLCVRHSMPEWLVRRFGEDFPDDVEALVQSLDARAPLTLRANTLLTDVEGLGKALEAEGIQARAGRWSPWALTLESRVNVFGLDAFKNGLFEVQDEGSQLIALATGAKAGDFVLDACAGGGGKTLAMSAMMENKGRIVACDVTERRVEPLKARAKRAKAFNLETRVVPEDASGDKALKRYLNRADVVLVDAPCSGTGALRRKPDARLRLTPDDVAAFPQLQLRILERYARCVKPGGRLVYATCSVLRVENDGVADAFLNTHPEFEPVAFDALSPETLDAGRLRLLPHVHGTDGFFAQGFRRRAEG